MGHPRQAVINTHERPLNSIVAYGTAPWETAMPVLRVTGPAHANGLQVFTGNEGPDIHVELASQADLVIIQRDFPRFASAYAQIMQRARQAGKPVLYEMDDLLLDVPEGHMAQADLVHAMFPMLWAIAEADAVTTSTAALQAVLQPLNPNTRLLPNYLNDRLWDFRPPQPPAEPSAPVVIGYMGGQTHLADLAYIEDALKTVLAHYEGRVSLKFWGGKPPAGLVVLPGVTWEALDIFDYAEFARYFSSQTCDIWIAPLAPGRFNQAKSAIKFLEYSALGIAGVYSRIAPYEEIVKHGENGLLAGDTSEWVSSLSLLVEQPELRYGLALAAQQMVRQDWLLSAHAGLWLQVYQEAVDLAPGSPERLERFDLLAGAAGQVRERLDDLEQENIRLSQDLAASTSTAEGLRLRLDEILQSRSWQLLQKTHQVRYKLAPLNSRRAQILQKIGLLARRA